MDWHDWRRSRMPKKPASYWTGFHNQYMPPASGLLELQIGPTNLAQGADLSFRVVVCIQRRKKSKRRRAARKLSPGCRKSRKKNYPGGSRWSRISF
jgi:hypothetical protein